MVPTTQRGEFLYKLQTVNEGRKEGKNSEFDVLWICLTVGSVQGHIVTLILLIAQYLRVICHFTMFNQKHLTLLIV